MSLDAVYDPLTFRFSNAVVPLSVPEPASVIVLADGVNVPLFVQFPPTDAANEPASSVAPLLIRRVPDAAVVPERIFTLLPPFENVRFPYDCAPTICVDAP